LENISGVALLTWNYGCLCGMFQQLEENDKKCIKQ